MTDELSQFLASLTPLAMGAMSMDRRFGDLGTMGGTQSQVTRDERTALVRS